MKVQIQGVPAFNGEYEIEPRFTMRERQLIRDISNLHGFEMHMAILDDHPGLGVAFAVIAVQRKHGRLLSREETDLIWDALDAEVRLVFDDLPEDDASPPAQADPTASEESGNGSEKSDSSGASSRVASASPDELQSRTGARG